VNAVVAELTTSQKILLAAYHLEEQGQTPFSAEALIVAAWQENQRTFGLKGFADQHPDSNRILSCIMGEKGLAKRGWLAKMGQKLYSLTRKGRDEVQHIKSGGSKTPTKRATAAKPTRYKVPRDQEKSLMTLFGAVAVKRFQEGLKREITFGDACKFWNITESMRSDEIEEHIDKVTTTLVDVGEMIEGSSVELSNGRSVSQEDLDSLNEVQDYLKEQFSRHLTLLRNRSGRN
jgi:hypothetical protein